MGDKGLEVVAVVGEKVLTRQGFVQMRKEATSELMAVSSYGWTRGAGKEICDKHNQKLSSATLSATAGGGWHVPEQRNKKPSKP